MNGIKRIRLLLEWHKEDKENREIKAKLWQLFVDENKSQTNEPVLSQWRDFIDAERHRQNEEIRIKRLEQEKRIEEEKKRREAYAKSSREYNIAQAKEGSIFCMMHVCEKLLTGSDGLEPDVPFAVELLVDGYWKVVSCLRGELWSANIDEFYAVFIGDRSKPPMINDSMMWSISTSLCNDINGVVRDLRYRKEEKGRREAEKAEERRIAEQKKSGRCKNCRYLSIGGDTVYEDRYGEIVEVPNKNKYTCWKCGGKTVSLNGNCDLWVQEDSPKNHGYTVKG